MSPAYSNATLRERIVELVGDVSGLSPSSIDPNANFFSLGLNSLMFMQIRDRIERELGVELAVSQFTNDVSTLVKLTGYLEERLALVPSSESQPPPVPDRSDQTGRTGETSLDLSSLSGLDTLFRRQLDVLERQNEILLSAFLNGGGAAPAPSRPAPAPPGKAYVPFKAIVTSRSSGVAQEHVEALARLLGEKCKSTKDLTQKHRRVFGNNRAIAGFRPDWKEMVYPLIAARADGSRIWDPDGNEYIDLTMGFGVALFGHNPAFVMEAIRAELANGMPLGPLSPLAGEVAELIAELTGVERVAFFNSGTEAVMVALRLARTVTGRARVAIFSGSFHGSFDGILAIRGAGGRTLPMLPGSPAGIVADVIVLDYDDPASLDYVAAHGGELAAVLVEPVQSRHVEIQPRDFLHRLRELTAASGTALIFDEVITGFRIHPGGAQARFDVRADIVTYGKIIGGGLPIGIVAGRAEFIDAVDGGMWQYGDESYPAKKNTFVSGTFCHHPLAMAAARAVLLHLRREGPKLQEDLNQRTAAFVTRMADLFRDRSWPIRIACFGSLFRMDLMPDHELLYYHLLDKGVYVWEGRNCFLSTAHSDGDIEAIETAIRASAEAIERAGLFHH
ncbi:MAG: aminotransferase class III-fold pyridoxal phosphate-dependent enzyme [Acidobacteriota bacterium]